MMRSLYSGISGLRNHQTRMDVIGNNIANVNTAGYKSSRVIFQDIFSQNVSAGMANQGNIGGTNPKQIGLGIRLSSVDVIHSNAAFGRTDNETDMMINGDGFFIVMQQNPETGEEEYMYTRAGNFIIDSEGYLVTSHGYFVMGYTVDPMMGIVDPGQPAIATVAGKPAAAQVTTTELVLADHAVGSIIPRNSIVDGWPRTAVTLVAGQIIPEGTLHPNQPAFRVPMTGNLSTATLMAADGVTDTTTALGTSLPWAQANAVTAVQGQPYKPPIFGLVQSGLPNANQGLNKIRVVSEAYQGINWDDLTDAQRQALQPRVTTLQMAFELEDFDAILAAQESINQYIRDNLMNAFPPEKVSLPGFAVADNGDVSVIIANKGIVIGRVGVAMFANPEGLEKAGSSLYRESASSGPVIWTEAYNEGAGEINAGGLEMSNVDLADQFTDMIVTQRGFQANSRIITVSDTMLEELVNLKR